MTGVQTCALPIYPDRNNPLDSSEWGDVSLVTNVQVTGRYGDKTLKVNTTDGLVVGMAVEGYGYLTPVEDDQFEDTPNTIVAIDTDKSTITMRTPYHGPDGNSYYYDFVPIMSRTWGDGLCSLAYGNGAFVGMGYDNSGRSYKTTDMATFESSLWAEYTQGNGPWGINYDNSVFYGAVTTAEATIRNTSETISGFTNYLNVGDKFEVALAGGESSWTGSDLAYQFGIGGIQIDPARNSWYIGTASSPEGFEYGDWGYKIGRAHV